jgi:cysteinyl-tRNA synthetase
MRLYDSLTRDVHEVVPTEGDTVEMYSCGPTVYRYAHVGNMRTFMLGDLIRRVLRQEGRSVRWVMNITDVGHMTDDATDTGRDRMDLAMEDEGLSPEDIADKYTRAFLEDADAVGIERADAYPKATEHIPEMIELTRQLIERGHAYEVEGTVYFDVRSFPAYGGLSGNTLDSLRAGHRQELEQDPNKRHPEDFALWKKAGPGRLMTWDSPWGQGFPGWHIECSAMSMKFLGNRFDIHTGGNDLKFPHHEDEIAQSEGATGHQVVGLWVHGGFLQMSGQKMSKSARNIKRVSELADQGIDPLAFRLLCLGTRYRSEMDFSWDALQATDRGLTRLRERMADWAGAERDGLSPEAKELDTRFRDAVADDLDMPEANFAAAAMVLAIASVSFIGIGMMTAVLPLISPEKGAQLGFVAQGMLLVVSGVYYPTSVLPEWMQWVSVISPATYALDGIRDAILAGDGVSDMGDEIWPLLVIGAVAVPLGLLIFRLGERHAKQHGKLKRSG